MNYYYTFILLFKAWWLYENAYIIQYTCQNNIQMIQPKSTKNIKNKEKNNIEIESNNINI